MYIYIYIYIYDFESHSLLYPPPSLNLTPLSIFFQWHYISHNLSIHNKKISAFFPHICVHCDSVY